MNARLDLETIRTFTSPTGDSLVAALSLKQYRKTLVSLHQLYQKLLDEAPELAKAAGFVEAFEALRTVEPPAQQSVLRYPSARIWLDTAWGLVRRQSHIRFPLMHVRMHLEEFARIALAAVLQSGRGRDFEGVTWTDANGRVMLPGAGAYLESSRADAYQRVTISTHHGSVTVRARDQARARRFESVQKVVPTIADSIELNAIDFDLRRAGQGSFVFEELGLEAIVKWRSTLEQSWAWISECSPSLAGEMTTSLRVIIPVRSSSVEVHTSASFRETPGLIALSWTPDASVMVEALVHEYHHQKLNTLLTVDPVIVGPTTAATYYSPWRPDARPLLGVLHGAYAFQAVLQFYTEMFDANVPLLHETRIRQRMYLLKGQVQTALNTLSDLAQLSPLGEALVNGMREKIDSLDVVLPISQRPVQQRLDELQAEHRTRWEHQHQGLQKGDRAINERLARTVGNPCTQTERRVLDWLHQNAGLDPASFEAPRFELEPLLNSVIRVFHAGTHAELKEILEEATNQSLLRNLIEGHVAYLEGEYESAASRYESCVTFDSSNVSYWQYYAFALRHLAQWRDAYKILTNLERLTRVDSGRSLENIGGIEEWLARVENSSRTGRPERLVTSNE